MASSKKKPERAERRPKRRIAVLRAWKQAELTTEGARLELRTPLARERHVHAQSIARATGIALASRDNALLRELAKVAERFLAAAPTGQVFDASGRPDFSADVSAPTEHPPLVGLDRPVSRAQEWDFEMRLTMHEEPDLAAEIPLFYKSPVAPGTRSEAATELRAFVGMEIGREYPEGEPLPLQDRLARLVVACTLHDETGIGEVVRRRVLAPAAPTVEAEAVWRKALTLVANRIETVMRSATTPDPQAIVRAALDELGYDGRRNASLFEAGLAREKYALTKAKPPSVH